jgi:hypothetical protein
MVINEIERQRYISLRKNPCNSNTEINLWKSKPGYNLQKKMVLLTIYAGDGITCIAIFDRLTIIGQRERGKNIFQRGFGQRA